MTNRGSILCLKIRNDRAWSQQQLADRLLVSRNYIALIERDRKQPSVRLLSQLEALASVDNKDNTGGMERSEATYGKADLSRQVRSQFEEVFSMAAQDPERLIWMREQLRAHLRPPPHWAEDDAGRKKIAELRRTARTSEEDPLQSQGSMTA